jgi:hypothetical protein
MRRVAGEIRVEIPLVGRSFLLAGKSSHERRNVPLYGDGIAGLIGIRIPLLRSGASASQELSQTSKTLSMRLAKNCSQDCNSSKNHAWSDPLQLAPMIRNIELFTHKTSREYSYGTNALDSASKPAKGVLCETMRRLTYGCWL